MISKYTTNTKVCIYVVCKLAVIKLNHFFFKSASFSCINKHIECMCVCMYMYLCMYICMYVCVYACLNVCRYACMYAYMYVFSH